MSQIKSVEINYNNKAKVEPAKTNIAETIKKVIEKEIEAINLELDNSNTEEPKINVPNNNWIFGQDALKNKQFGGNQGAFIEDLDYWLKDRRAIEIIHSYYPEATLEEIEALYYKMNETGCGYIAMINSIMYEFIIHDEMEFREIFGFNPYELIYGVDGKLTKDYNYEYLFLDFYLWFAKNSSYVDIKKGKLCEGCETMQDVLEIMNGIYGFDRIGEIFTNYLAEKGIQIKVITEYMTDEETKKYCEELGLGYIPDNKIKKDLTIDIIEKYLKMGLDYVIEIGAGELTTDDGGVFIGQFDLYYPYDKDGNGKLDDLYCHCEDAGHAMTVVGTTSDPNKIVVSSWGEEFLVDISQIGASYCIIDYSEFNNQKK